MQLPHLLTMCSELSSFFDHGFRWSRPSCTKKPSPPFSVYEAWLKSRALPDSPTGTLIPGAQRKINKLNLYLAYIICRECAGDVFGILWKLHPYRASLMVVLNILRSLFPAFRGYSQALVIDEIQSLIASGTWTWTRIAYMLAYEGIRRLFESVLESFALSNETIVQNSARFFMEYQQLEQRVRLDIPTLADPHVRDLLQECEMFSKSFNGMGFGMLSPLDAFQIIGIFAELVSHVMVLWSLAGGTTAQFLPMMLTLLSALLPLLGSWFSFSGLHPEALYTPEESKAAERAQKLQNLAYSDSHRPEILVFGLGPWILSTWAQARKTLIRAEQTRESKRSRWELNFSQIVFTMQNIPLLLVFQTTPMSLGTLALWRSSIHAIIFTAPNVMSGIKMVFQSIFLMGSFAAAMKIRPSMEPSSFDAMTYVPSGKGMRIQARNLSYTYPGAIDPALRDVSFLIEPGETVCIVGYNGSGKTTLANILLRLTEFDDGQLLINDSDVRKLDPVDFHSHVTAVLQGFAKHNVSVEENVGVGSVQDIGSTKAIRHAVNLAGATPIVDSLPQGSKTVLAPGGFEYPSFSSFDSSAASEHHGLSGGEWQRIAISRAFMRAEKDEVDLMLFDEPTSALDGHAQTQVFDTIDRISRCPTTDEKRKTTVFITHRLSTARRADKILMMAGGQVIECGSHEELLKRGGQYATLYVAST